MGGRPEEVHKLVSEAVGKECWSVLISDSGDDALVLDLGEKQRRSLRLANPNLSFVQRTYEGEYNFLIECVWRLDGHEGVVATSLDEDRKSGVRARKLTAIQGRRLMKVEVLHEGYDLSLHFDGGYALHCFSALAQKKRLNWSFYSPDIRVSIGTFGHAETESRKTLEKRLHSLKRAIRGDDGDVVATFLRARGIDKPDEEAQKARGPAKVLRLGDRAGASTPPPKRNKTKNKKKKTNKKPRSSGR